MNSTHYPVSVNGLGLVRHNFNDNMNQYLGSGCPLPFFTDGKVGLYNHVTAHRSGSREPHGCGIRSTAFKYMSDLQWVLVVGCLRSTHCSWHPLSSDPDTVANGLVFPLMWFHVAGYPGGALGRPSSLTKCLAVICNMTRCMRLPMLHLGRRGGVHLPGLNVFVPDTLSRLNVPVIRCACVNRLQVGVAEFWRGLDKDGKIESVYGKGWSILMGTPDIILKTVHKKSGSRWAINLVGAPKVGATQGRS